MSEIVVPDRIGEVYGWRAWKVIGGEQFPLLASVTHSGTVWHPDRWTYAICEDKDGRQHDRCAFVPTVFDTTIPAQGHSCGLYAAASRQQLVNLGYWRESGWRRKPVFIGVVALAGKVIPGTQGWRAQKGRIAELYVPHVHWRYVGPLEEMYRVPVVLSNTSTVPEGGE